MRETSLTLDIKLNNIKRVKTNYFSLSLCIGDFHSLTLFCPFQLGKGFGSSCKLLTFYLIEKQVVCAVLQSDGTDRHLPQLFFNLIAVRNSKLVTILNNFEILLKSFLRSTCRGEQQFAF